MKEILRKNKYWLISLAAALVACGVWELAARLLDLAIALPTFTSVAAAFFALFADGKFYTAVGLTLVRCLIGYVIWYALGIVCGIIAGKYRGFAAAISPLVAAMRAVPVVAITLVLTIWIGPNILPSVIGVMVVFPTVYAQIRTATENIDPTLNDVLTEMGSGFAHSARTVYLPLVLPYALSGISATFGMNIKAVISAEVLAYTVHSIGYEIYFAKANFLEETPTLFAWVIVAVLLSVIFEFVLRLLTTRLTRRISWMGA